MHGVDPQAFAFAINNIHDGNIFEKFCLDFLAKILQYNFISAGGIRDRGIDGLEHTFHREHYERTIYQLSIEKDYKNKIKNSINKLNLNKIKYDQFIYVTNLQIKAIDQLIDELVAEYKKPIQIYDQNWLVSHVNDTESTIRAYYIFIESYLHKFSLPGASYEVANIVDDPRLYVFLRQQWDDNSGNLKLDDFLADSLILYALEETDPDRGILLSRDNIIDRIRSLVKFDPQLLHDKIEERLKILSKNPQRINHHTKDDTFCLRFEERLAIKNRNLHDIALYERFRIDTVQDIEKYIRSLLITGKNGFQIVEYILHSLFFKQGLEFANFILKGTCEDVIEKALPDIVNEAVDANTKLWKGNASSGNEIKSSLLITIRNMVYNGTTSQKQFLDQLSHTYMMLFLLQCDPKLSTYFNAMAGKLNVYVCTSIIIPALTERFLDEPNKRYTNLLIRAHQAGVKLVINEGILDELASHFKFIKAKFEEYYKDWEYLYTEELEILYVQQIMIRAYFYSRMRGKVNNFDDFLNSFVSPTMRHLDSDLIELLKNDLHIEYVSNSPIGLHLDPSKLKLLSIELTKHKPTRKRAETDAATILTIHELREKNNELGTSGVFGYSTWWLSSDIVTQRAITSVFGEHYKDSCYMRPDFLYNYISLSPTRNEIKDAFAEIFPTLLGLNISFHIPQEITDQVIQYTKEHKNATPTRIKAQLRELADNLKSDPTYRTRERVELFLNDRVKQL